MRISDWSSDVCSSDLDPGDGYLYACSTGFNVSQGRTPGYVTAGHCGDTGEPVYLEGPDGTGPQPTVGPKLVSFAGSSFPQPGGNGPAYAWLRAAAGTNLQPPLSRLGVVPANPTRPP